MKVVNNNSQAPDSVIQNAIYDRYLLGIDNRSSFVRRGNIKRDPLLAHVYPNGMADVNHFHEAGGLGFLIGQLLEAGLLHRDVNTILGRGLDRFTVTPKLADQQIEWQDGATEPGDRTIVRKAGDPFQAEGGVQLVQGNIGRAIVKVSP